MKKIMLTAVFLAVLAAVSVTADAPKTEVFFTQSMTTEVIDSVTADSQISDSDPLRILTEVGAKAAYKFDAFTVTPWAKNRYEGKYGTGNLAGDAGDADIEKLGKIRERNRFYLGVDNSFKVSDLLNIALNFEYRLAADLRTDKSGDALLETRVMPVLALSGKSGDFSYSIKQGVPVYLDATVGDYDNDADDMVIELEGSYGISYGFKLGETAMKFDVSDALLITNPSNAALDADSSLKATTNNKLTGILSMKFGEITPALGFLNVRVTNAAGDVTDNIMGGSAGVTLAKDKWSFSVLYEAGINKADGKNDAVESALKAEFKSKL